MYRRSIYLLNKRTVRLPMMANFDQPDAMSSCAVDQYRLMRCSHSRS